MSQSKQLNKEHAEKLIEGFFNVAEKYAESDNDAWEDATFLAAIMHYEKYIFDKFKNSALCPYRIHDIKEGKPSWDGLDDIRSLYEQTKRISNTICNKRSEPWAARKQELMRLFSIFKSGMIECFQEKIEES